MDGANVIMRPSVCFALLRHFKFGKSVLADVTFRPRIRGLYELLRNIFRPWLRGCTVLWIRSRSRVLRRSFGAARTWSEKKEQKCGAHRFHGR